jgi:hypothetical protein
MAITNGITSQSFKGGNSHDDGETYALPVDTDHLVLGNQAVVNHDPATTAGSASKTRAHGTKRM